MLLNHSGSYYEEYRRGKSGTRQTKGNNISRVESSINKNNSAYTESERLLTDRSAYISFLEVQLERVAAACLTSQSFSERIEQIQATIFGVEERVNNLAKAHQQSNTRFDTFVLDQDRKFTKVGETTSQACTLIQNIQDQLSKLEDKLSTTETSILSNVHQIEASQQKQNETQESINSDLLDKLQHVKVSIGDVGSKLAAETTPKIQQIESQLTQVEKKLGIQCSMQDQLRSLVVSKLSERGGVLGVSEPNNLSFTISDSYVTSRTNVGEGNELSSANFSDEVNAGMGTTVAKPRAIVSSAANQQQSVPLVHSMADDQQQEFKQQDASPNEKLHELENRMRGLDTSVNFAVDKLLQLSSNRAEEDANQVVNRLTHGLDEHLSPGIAEHVKQVLSSSAPRSSAVKVEPTSSRTVQVRVQNSGGNSSSNPLGFASMALSQDARIRSTDNANTTAGGEQVPEHFNSIVHSTLEKQEEKFREKLDSMSDRLDEHVGMVRESMSKVAQFFDLYETTHLDLESRLVKGKDFQNKLRQLLRDATGQVTMVNEEMRNSYYGTDQTAAVTRGGKLDLSQLETGARSSGKASKAARKSAKSTSSKATTKTSAKVNTGLTRSSNITGRRPVRSSALKTSVKRNPAHVQQRRVASSNLQQEELTGRHRRGSVEEDPGKSLDGGGKRGRSQHDFGAGAANNYQTGGTRTPSPVLRNGPLAGMRLKQTRVRSIKSTEDMY